MSRNTRALVALAVAVVLGVIAVVVVAATRSDDAGVAVVPPGPLPSSTPTAAAPPTDPASPEPPRLTTVASGYDELTAIVSSPDGTGLWVTERPGKIWNQPLDGGERSLVLDISSDVMSDGGEQGLLGLAIAPDSSALVVDYVNRQGEAGTTIVARYPITKGTVDRDAPTVLFSVEQPFANHNGGQVAFGPDGKLYVGLGDGGSQDDPNGNGQSRATPLAKILRLDPTTGKAPADNPFVDQDGTDPRIWLYGVRNPWRFSFDADGDLWIGDVGGSRLEEVDHLSATQARGANLGWHLREGNADTAQDGERTGLTEPIAVFSHADGWCSIIGGYLDAAGTGLAPGSYVFGDYCLSHLWVIDAKGAPSELTTTDIDHLSTLGLGPDRRLYAGNIDGDLYRVEGS